MLDLRVVLAAAVLASPAVVRAADGTLPMEEALTRVLLVMLGAAVLSLLVRTVWPLLAGPPPEPRPADDEPTALFAETAELDAMDAMDGIDETVRLSPPPE